MRLPAHQHGYFFRLICSIILLALLLVRSHDALAEQEREYLSFPYGADECDSSSALFPADETLRDNLEKFIGIPYRWGGTSEKGMDCSGLAKHVYSRFLDVNLPHNSAAQSQVGVLEEIAFPEDELETGDLLFFGPGKKRVNHVGIYLSEGKFIHASRRSGVRISCLDRNYWNNRLMATKRLKALTLPRASRHRGAFRLEELFALPITDPFERSMQTLELGCSRSILHSLNLSLDLFLQMSPATSRRQERTLNLDGWDQSRFDTLLTLETQGFRLFMDLTPLNWLRITPSVTHLRNLGNETDLSETAVQVFGVEALLKPPASRWSFAMSAQTGNQENSFNWTPRSSPSRGSLEMTFALGLDLSDSLAFSFIGMSRDYGMRDISDQDEKLLPFFTDFAFEVGFAF